MLLEAASISDDGHCPDESHDGEAQIDSPQRPSTPTQAEIVGAESQKLDRDYHLSANDPPRNSAAGATASGFHSSFQEHASASQFPAQVEKDQDQHGPPAHIAWDALLRGIEEVESSLDCCAKIAIRSQLVAASARQR
jgi:hypothetical protein